MLRNILRITLNRFARLRISPRCFRIRRASIQNCICSTVSFYGIVYAQDYAQDYPSKDHVEIHKTVLEREKRLAQNMCKFRMFILEYIIQYQECLIDLIEITKENTLIGQVGEDWDELVSFRIKANEVKDELTRLEALATNMEVSIVKKQTFGNHIVLDHLNGEFMKLQKLCRLFLAESHIYEAELLEVSFDSILYAAVGDEVD